MNILYLSPRDPRATPSLWSGTALSILRGFESHGHAVHVVTVQSPWADPYTAIKYRWYRDVRKQMYFRDLDPLNLPCLRHTIRRAVRGVKFDAVFAWLPWMTLLVDTDRPRLFWYDTTYVQTQPMYFPNVCPASHEQSLRLDRAAVAQSEAAVYCSEWARQAAINEYRAAPDKVHAIPFGANLSDVPTADTVARAIDARLARSDAVHLLFVGYAWERKGGPVALEVLSKLLAAGQPARLTIVGASPAVPAALEPYVVRVGPLDKQVAGDERRLRELYLESDWFFMTSRNESYGIVYCEAMAHGLPSLATRTGAVAELVQSGESGELFDWSEQLADQIAAAILRYRADPERYRALCHNAHRRYDKSFNWTAASARFNEVLTGVARR